MRVGDCDWCETGEEVEVFGTDCIEMLQLCEEHRTEHDETCEETLRSERAEARR